MYPEVNIPCERKFSTLIPNLSFLDGPWPWKLAVYCTRSMGLVRGGDGLDFFVGGSFKNFGEFT